MTPVNEGGEEDDEGEEGQHTQGRKETNLPIRGGKPNSNQVSKDDPKEAQSDEMDKQDGLKLRLELNLDIELELKASIRGDITLALL